MRSAVPAIWVWGCLATVVVGQTMPASRPEIGLPLASTRPVEKKPATTRPHAKTGLDELCPLLWRGTLLREALAELADRLEVRYILDASIPATTLDEPVRISALYLTGQQAFRWLAADWWGIGRPGGRHLPCCP